MTEVCSKNSKSGLGLKLEKVDTGRTSVALTFLDMQKKGEIFFIILYQVALVLPFIPLFCIHVSIHELT